MFPSHITPLSQQLATFETESSCRTRTAISYSKSQPPLNNLKMFILLCMKEIKISTHLESILHAHMTRSHVYQYFWDEKRTKPPQLLHHHNYSVLQAMTQSLTICNSGENDAKTTEMSNLFTNHLRGLHDVTYTSDSTTNRDSLVFQNFQNYRKQTRKSST